MKALLAAYIGMIALAASSVSGESLWLSKANRQTGLFADRTASNVGDILTVTVDESTAISSTLSKVSNSQSSFGGSDVSAFFGIDIGRGLTEGINATGLETNTIGGGTITNVQTIASSSSVLIIDRLPNGNLVIEGAREQIVSGETQYVIIRGVVRKDDIAPDNTIMSSKIANAQIEFLNKGQIASTQKQGWISKLLDVANVW